MESAMEPACASLDLLDLYTEGSGVMASLKAMVYYLLCLTSWLKPDLMDLTLLTVK